MEAKPSAFGMAAFYRACSTLPTLLEFREVRVVLRLLLRLLRRRVTPGETLWVTLRSTGFRFPVRTFWELWCLRETFVERAYESFGFPLMPGWTVVDVGAGIGDFAVFASRARQAGSVLALEPNPATFDLLKQAVSANGADAVTARCTAVSDRPGILFLGTNGDPVGMGTSSKATPAALAVQAESLTTLLESAGIARCDLLKLDCEGAEFEIFRSLVPQAYDGIRRIVVEYHESPGRTVGELEEILEAAGYEVRITPSAIYEGVGYLAAERAVNG